MDEKTFLVAEFDNGSVEVIPRAWLDRSKKVVQWPRGLSVTKMEKAIRNCLPPNEDWETFSLKRILAASDSFGRAKKKADVAIYTSSISDTDEDVDGKRKKKSRKRLLTEGSSSDEESVETVPHGEQNSRPLVPDFPSRDVEGQLNKPLVERGKRLQREETTKAESSSRRPERDISLQILRSIEAMKHEILLLRKQVSSLEQKCMSSSPSEEVGVASKTSFPVCSEEELASLNEELKDPAIMTSVVNELAKVGGINLHKLIGNMLKKVLANSLAQQYSCCGRKGKKSLSSLLIFQAIKRAVRKVFSTSTDADIQACISKFLAGAKDREGGRHDRRLLKAAVQQL